MRNQQVLSVLRPAPRVREQRGAASLVLVLIAAIGLMALTARSLQAPAAAQKLQFTEHVATQAELNAWSGVSILSAAVAKLTTPSQLTPGPLTLAGVPEGIAVNYVGTVGSNLRFNVIGTSAGATSALAVVLRPFVGGGITPSTPPNSYGTGQMYNGNTTLSGSVMYTGGGEPQNLSVLGGSLTLSGSVTGLNTVCATGDLSVSAAISANTLCSNGNILLEGAANAQRINAIGNVTLSGGAASSIGGIHSNGAVTLSGGSAYAGDVQATGSVAVTGGAASALNILTEGNINWTSTSSNAVSLSANGTVTYLPPSGDPVTDISAIGDVRVSAARNVATQGTTTLAGGYGQGISGNLKSQGLLSGREWGANGGARVASGTVGSITAPYPTGVHVTVQNGYTVSVPRVVVPAVSTFTLTKPTVDAYTLRDQANLVFTGVDASGNPQVQARGIAGVPDGNYLIANNPTGPSKDWLCRTASGGDCSSTPLARVCKSYSDYNTCFSYDKNKGNWSMSGGNTALPLVLWFTGNLDVGTGRWVNTFIASGDITTSGQMVMFAPNYPAGSYTCQGAADNTNNLPALSAKGLSGDNYATQLCAGSPRLPTSASVGNLSLVAGGIVNGVFSGGNITLGASSEVYGAILAGQYFSTGGATTVAGFTFAGKQGTGTGSNALGGSTKIVQNGGSQYYDPGTLPCTVNCSSGNAANNIIWVSPI